MNAQWQMWTAGVAPEVCNQIIEECEQLPAMEGQVGAIHTIGTNTKVRRSQVRWAGGIKWIHDLVWSYASRANKQAFGFDLALLEDIQYTEYDESQRGYYNWHQDTFWGGPTCFDRKLSVVIQLSDPATYRGGKFLLDEIENPAENELNQRGTVLVFPSPLRHMVEPVTSGKRRSLVAWVEGPKFR